MEVRIGSSQPETQNYRIQLQISVFRVVNWHLVCVAEIDPPLNNSSMQAAAPNKKQLCGGSKPAVERMLEFGRELFLLSVQLRQELGKSETNKKMLKVILIY